MLTAPSCGTGVGEATEGAEKSNLRLELNLDMRPGGSSGVSDAPRAAAEGGGVVAVGVCVGGALEEEVGGEDSVERAAVSAILPGERCEKLRRSRSSSSPASAASTEPGGEARPPATGAEDIGDPSALPPAPMPSLAKPGLVAVGLIDDAPYLPAEEGDPNAKPVI
jgi:hypothetical protein